MLRRTTLILATLALGAAATAFPRDARGYCRTTTRGVPANYNPVLSGCITEGVPLAWPSMPVTFELNEAASKQVSLADATPVIASAFAAWAAASCLPVADSGAQHPSVSFDMLPPTTAPFVPCDAGDQACEQAEGDGPHQIVFRDDAWPYQDTANTIALTTVSFGVDTGDIRAANMEINSHDHLISLADPPPAGAISLAAIATHEAGHFIGLAHSQKTSAVMYAYYEPGMTSLTRDDEDAVCAVYPPGVAGAGASSGCSCGVAGKSGDAVALGSLGSLGGLGLGLAALTARRRRRR